MNRRAIAAILVQSGITTLCVLLLLQVGFAQVRTSNSYQLQSDSINIGGGYTTSTNYTQESTVGEIATGRATSTSYTLLAGYQQMQEVFLSLSVSGGVDMDPDLPGLTGGESNGSTTVTVITDSPAGYRLTLESENAPAMRRAGGGGTIADYDQGVENDYSFVYGAGDAYFGFTPEGVDIVQAFKDGGGVCNVDTQDTALACWSGPSTTPIVIAEGTGSNHPSGATTSVHFRVGVGSGAGVLSGVYIATSTVTALPL